MAYFIVFQNKTYLIERDGSYLWAPQKNALNKSLFHWENMKKIKPGDVIISMFKQHFYSVNIAKKNAEEGKNPFNRSVNSWGEKGWFAEVDYNELSTPIPLKENTEKILNLCPDKYSPFTKTGKGNQGYLYEIDERLGVYILDLIKQKNVLKIK